MGDGILVELPSAVGAAQAAAAIQTALAASVVVVEVHDAGKSGRFVARLRRARREQGVGLDEVAWTIAGDDTILLICRTDKDGAGQIGVAEVGIGKGCAIQIGSGEFRLRKVGIA